MAGRKNGNFNFTMAKTKILKPTYEADSLPAELEKDMKKLEKKSFGKLIDQVAAEYSISYDFMRPKWDEWGLRLKLYNNQKRDKEKVGDPLLFTIHQTVLASLYQDRLMTSFGPRERGDMDVSQNLGEVAEFDYTEMDKDTFDYFWNWDAGFFGRSLAHFVEWNRERSYPIPELIDPMTFLRDPRATSAQGDQRGRNGLRWGYWEMRMTKNEMRDEGVYFNLDELTSPDGDAHSLIDANRSLRAEAQGFNDPLKKNGGLKGENAEYRLVMGYTMWKGKRVRVVLGNDLTTIHRFDIMKRKPIPIIDRAMYPMSHDWDGVSIPDIVEDKQRARSVIINLGLKTAKAALHPMYLFDANKIKNKNDLNFGFNKNVPVDGPVDNAIVPIQRAQINDSAKFILDLLDTASQKATATPDQQQGVTADQGKTAYEIGTTQQNVTTRYGLSAKVFGWSEKRFWQQWYRLYKDNFKADIDEKIVRIVGAINASWRPFTRENLIGQQDPDIIIESKILADAKRLQTLQGFTNFMNLVLAIPGSSKRYTVRRYGELQGLHRDDIYAMLPPNVHELKAEEENALLEASADVVQVDIADDDMIHMEIHNKASDTPAKYAHIQAHKRAMLLKLKQPELVPADQQQNFGQGTPGADPNSPPTDLLKTTSAAPADSQPSAPAGRVPPSASAA